MGAELAMGIFLCAMTLAGGIGTYIVDKNPKVSDYLLRYICEIPGKNKNLLILDHKYQVKKGFVVIYGEGQEWASPIKSKSIDHIDMNYIHFKVDHKSDYDLKILAVKPQDSLFIFKDGQSLPLHCFDQYDKAENFERVKNALNLFPESKVRKLNNALSK